jgi:hypothetical protein
MQEMNGLILLLLGDQQNYLRTVSSGSTARELAKTVVGFYYEKVLNNNVFTW